MIFHLVDSPCLTPLTIKHNIKNNIPKKYLEQ